MRIIDAALTDFHRVRSTDSVATVEPLLLRDKAVAVDDDGAFIGILTLSDVMRRGHRLVADCVSRKPSVRRDDSVGEVLDLMESTGLHFLPIVEDGDVRGIVSYKALVRRMAEERERALEVYESVFDSTDEAIVIVRESDGSIREANQATARLLGRPIEDIRGRPVDSLGIRHRPPWTDAPEDGRGEARLGEGIVRRADGVTRWVEAAVSVAALWGEPHRILALRDVTEVKAWQDQFHKVEQYDSLRLLAGGVAHDFNNLLTGLRAYIDFARKEPGLPGEAGDMLGLALGLVDQSARLTQQLMWYAKDGTVTREKVDLRAFVEQTLTLLLAGRAVPLAVVFPSDLRPVEIGRDQFSQVLNNLAINAVQAGATEISISAANLAPGAAPRPCHGADAVRISIRDDGQGIGGDRLPRIFEPYYTTKEQGSGIGLAVVRSIVEKHGGCVEVESAIGSGTTFHIFLPAAGT